MSVEEGVFVPTPRYLFVLSQKKFESLPIVLTPVEKSTCPFVRGVEVEIVPEPEPPPPVAKIVIGLEPITVNGVHDALPEHDTVVVANVFRSPLLPTASPPCERDESLKAELTVDDAVDRNPLLK